MRLSAWICSRFNVCFGYGGHSIILLARGSSDWRTVSSIERLAAHNGRCVAPAVGLLENDLRQRRSSRQSPSLIVNHAKPGGGTKPP